MAISQRPWLPFAGLPYTNEKPNKEDVSER
jgi:hypothetical protein